MQSHRSATTGYLLPRLATLAVLLAVMGCDNDRNTDDDIAVSDAEPAQTAPPQPVSDEGTAKDSVARNTQPPVVESAIAQIKPTSHGEARGTVKFSPGEDEQEMRVTVRLEGLEPGPHGLHIHEVGDCSADDASSAGGHFNPRDSSHGSPDASEHHMGDMGNIEANEDGRVTSELTFRGFAFTGPASILRKAVVIHSDKDDLESQPAGDAGDRVGCGVIRTDGKGSAQ